MQTPAATGATPTRGAASGTSVLRMIGRFLGSEKVSFFLVLVLFVVLWELVVLIFPIRPYVLPGPGAVADAMWREWRELLHHTLATSVEIVLGFLLAAVVGFAGGALMFYYRWADRLLSPPIVAFQNVPKVALAPIFVVWFGTTLTPRVLVAFVIAFFPVLVNTMVGLRATRKVSLEWVRSMGATRWQTFVKVQLPASLPTIFAGLRVATTLVVIGAVVGEYIAANAGLGYLQLVATTNLDAPILFASIIVMAVLGLILYEIVAFLEKVLLPWAKPPEDAAA